jgi:hypothetical protein
VSAAPGPIELRALASLRPHPENGSIFGDPEECEQWSEILGSIRKRGIIEPLIIKADGTILSGHVRRAVAEELKLKEVPVRVAPAFESYRAEVEFLIKANTERRQLTKAEIAIAFKRLRELPREQGGTKGKRGGDRRSKAAKDQAPARRGLKSKDPAADEAASVLGIGADTGRALEKVFTTPGVPDEFKAAVNKGTIAATPAAKIVTVELKRQGGVIVEDKAFKVVVTDPPKAPPTASDHERRVAEEAQKFARDYRELFELYRRVDGILTRRPLKTVLGYTDHHEYAGLVRDIAVRAWREVESVQGPTNTGKQMALVVIDGGRA